MLQDNLTLCFKKTYYNKLIVLNFNFSASSQAKRVKVDFPNGLENDDIIRWKGVTGKTKLIAVMVIRPASTRAKSFRLEIQAFRKRVKDSCLQNNVFFSNNFYKTL